MEFEPVWVSTTDHLNKFFEIMDQTPTWRKLLGRFLVPPEYPRLTSMNPLVGNIPVAMFASGRLSVHESGFGFESTPFHVPGGSVKGLTQSQWQLSIRDIRSIALYKYPKEFIKYYTLPWVRITTPVNLLSGDFLLCAGGLGPSMEKIKRDTETLYRALLRHHNPTEHNT